MGMWRHVRTASIRRAYAQTLYNELGVAVRVRARRRAPKLWTAWDDYDKPRTRSWKDYRRTQYRARHVAPYDPFEAPDDEDEAQAG